MKVHVKLDINDEERNIMHALLTGKVSKKMVSRADVVSFVQGMIDAVTHQNSEAAAISTKRLSPAEQKMYDRLKKQGKDDSYCHGQLQIVRRYGLRP